jgi:hypothetical protein
MGGLFSSDTASKYNKKQQQQITKAQKSNKDTIGKAFKKGDRVLEAEYNRLQDGGGFRPANYTGPGHNIAIDQNGNINMGRTGEAQGVMDRLLSGMDTDEGSFGALLSQITPGFGRLSQARGAQIDADRERGVGNLREQLAKRRVLGASFANDQIGSLERQYMMDKDKALAESLTQELEMTNNVIQARSEARVKSVSTALNEIQFETNVGAQLMQSVMSNMHDLTMAMTDIAKLRASLGLQAGLGVANANTTLANTGIGSQTEFANLESQEKAAPGQLLGSIAGMALGGWASGGFGGLGSLLGGSTASAVNAGTSAAGSAAASLK